MNRCTVEVGDDLVGGLSCLVQREEWRRACMPGAVWGEGAPACTSSQGWRLHKAWQPSPSPWNLGRQRECQHRGIAGGTGCPAGSTLDLCVPAPLLSSHLSRGSKRAVSLAPTGAFLLPGQGALWCCPCSLGLVGSKTKQCFILGSFCFRLCLTSSTSGHAGRFFSVV